MSESTTYDVVLLVEQPLSAQDAQQVRGLHTELEEDVRYHVLLPVEDAAGRIESAMGALSAGDALVGPPMAMDPEGVEDLQHELLETARRDLATSVEALTAAGGRATGVLVTDEPVHALVDKSKELAAAEVIVLTRPHVVAEFFHVDWTSRARRKLGVPVLHLLEHESFDEQAGGGEGVSGF
ncbi:hypothetical protein [Nocardioides marmoribigeumensis]|jgi:hypothetical protein|uniref:Universal stress protein n=1 Tax=Nocardioides marmoribigeumensis TaxID=433649 RepID=A0ABU2C1T2_9ACTN|nr:hypothetical protein [Nocardioides marmoribigeumensis]MDR7364628.1 hypothetical protein [Nocardioides marmoribigeumensis]